MILANVRRIKILELPLWVFIHVILVLFSAPFSLSNAQESRGISLLEFKYGFHIPAADMADRFGTNSDLGISFLRASRNTRIFAGAEGMFLFGSEVKEDVLSNLRTFDGSIIGLGGAPADVSLRERGFYIGLMAGKIFPTGKENKSLTGIRTQFGVGFMQHKIRVQDNSRSVVALEKEYLPGYDRLSNGPAFHLAAGFHYQSIKSNFQFHIMGDLYGARTKSRRDFDIPTGGLLSDKRTDILAGITIAYVVSISRGNTADEIYY